MQVPRTLDLTHVDLASYSAAIGRDPAMIFQFVRDHIAWEIYPGVLRGPRGTLLALAGNSLDRAYLLGSLLRHAGHEIRYASATLSAREAEQVVALMWSPRRPAAIRPSRGADDTSQRIVASARRDYGSIGRLLGRGRVAGNRAALTPSTLIAWARTPYWVQMRQEGPGLTSTPHSLGRASPRGKALPEILNA